MPIICRFFGIAIYMYWRDHPPPHFHAKYAGQEVTVEIETGKVAGDISGRALSMIQEWRRLHVAELLEDWRRAEGKLGLSQIAPLE
jgi:hypothetical protein